MLYLGPSRTTRRALREQAAGGADYAVNNDEWKKLSTHRIRRADKDVTVTVPVDSEPDPLVHPIPQSEARESIRVQALLAEIGSRMGMQIWLPRNDKANVEAEWRGDHPAVLDRLPLNYDDTTLRTIEQIDVLWLKGRAIKRAFEVEHTTSIYSGILRMADLLALQPNMDIRLHIVAPIGRRDKVFQELRRSVFSLLDRGPLSESCTYLSYDSVRELSDQPHLAHLGSRCDHRAADTSCLRRGSGRCRARAARRRAGLAVFGARLPVPATAGGGRSPPA